MEGQIDRLNELLVKYRANRCSKAEFDELFDIIRDRELDNELNELLKVQWDEAQPKPTKRRTLYRWYAAAAAVAAILVATVFFFREPTSQPTVVAQQQEAPQPVLTASTSQLVLADGSTVILREGSKLNQLESFNGKTREVSLEGEAYFDIAHNPAKPFIIHTGKIRTVVLGTAFSIKAQPYEQLVTVTVTRGKVKVEDGNKILAVLEANDQLSYNNTNGRLQEKVVNANSETAWKTRDLIFRNQPFVLIAQELGELYDVRIVFETESLKQRLITASIDGSEPIESILEKLCITQHAVLTVDGGVYRIKGKQ